MSQPGSESLQSPQTVDTLRRCAFRGLGWIEGADGTYTPGPRRAPQPPYDAAQKWADLDWHPREARHLNRAGKRQHPVGLLGCCLPLAKIHRLLLVGLRVEWEILTFQHHRARRLPTIHLPPLARIAPATWAQEGQRLEALRPLSSRIQGWPIWRSRDPRRLAVLQGIITSALAVERVLEAHAAVLDGLPREHADPSAESWSHARWHLREAQHLTQQSRWFLALGEINRLLAITLESQAQILRAHDRRYSAWEGPRSPSES